MPKGRMLNRAISIDEVVASLSPKANILYTWCIPHLDVEGRIQGDAAILKGVVVPYLEYMNLKVINNCVKEIAMKGLAVLYGNERKFLQFKGFRKNQTINKDREAPSLIPSPDKLLTKSGETPAEVKLSKDNISKDNVCTGPKGPTPTKFLDFVFLTDEEHQKLLSKYGLSVVATYIRHLNNYIGSKGKKYKSHYHTILVWAEKDGVKRIKKAPEVKDGPITDPKINALVDKVVLSKAGQEQNADKL